MSALIIWILTLLVGGFAGSGVYGYMDSHGYTGPGTGTFGFSNDFITAVYTIIAFIIPPGLKLTFERWWPIVRQILEVINVVKAPKQADDLDQLLEEFLEHAGKAMAITTKLDCGEAIELGGAWYSHCLTLIQEHRSNLDYEYEEDDE